jgi:hypothetical protein
MVSSLSSMMACVYNAEGIAFESEWCREKDNPALRTLTLDFEEDIKIAWLGTDQNPIVHVFVSEMIRLMAHMREPGNPE